MPARDAEELANSALAVLLADGELPAAQVLNIVAVRVAEAAAAAGGALDEGKESSEEGKERDDEGAPPPSVLTSGAALSVRDGFLAEALAAVRRRHQAHLELVVAEELALEEDRARRMPRGAGPGSTSWRTRAERQRREARAAVRRLREDHAASVAARAAAWRAQLGAAVRRAVQRTRAAQHCEVQRAEEEREREAARAARLRAQRARSLRLVGPEPLPGPLAALSARVREVRGLAAVCEAAAAAAAAVSVSATAGDAAAEACASSLLPLPLRAPLLVLAFEAVGAGALLRTCACVCREWQQAAASPALWARLSASALRSLRAPLEALDLPCASLADAAAGGGGGGEDEDALLRARLGELAEALRPSHGDVLAGAGALSDCYTCDFHELRALSRPQECVLRSMGATYLLLTADRCAARDAAAAPVGGAAGAGAALLHGAGAREQHWRKFVSYNGNGQRGEEDEGRRDRDKQWRDIMRFTHERDPSSFGTIADRWQALARWQVRPETLALVRSSWLPRGGEHTHRRTLMANRAAAAYHQWAEGVLGTAEVLHAAGMLPERVEALGAALQHGCAAVLEAAPRQLHRSD